MGPTKGLSLWKSSRTSGSREQVPGGVFEGRRPSRLPHHYCLRGKRCRSCETKPNVPFWSRSGTQRDRSEGGRSLGKQVRDGIALSCPITPLGSRCGPSGSGDLAGAEGRAKGQRCRHGLRERAPARQSPRLLTGSASAGGPLVRWFGVAQAQQWRAEPERRRGRRRASLTVVRQS